MQVLTDFLTSWYGVAVALGAALSLFWGIAKAVGALRSWLHKRYTERQEQLASPKKLLNILDHSPGRCTLLLSFMMTKLKCTIM